MRSASSSYGRPGHWQSYPAGFSELADLSAKTPESLMRMLGPKGNPRAKNLLDIIQVFQEQEGLQLKITAMH